MTKRRIRLYGFDGSNSCVSATLLLDHAGVQYERVRLRPGLHPMSLKLRRFPGMTVPALSVGDRKVVGSRRIARLVAEELAPEAGLLPADAAQRERVLEIEREGERLQNAVRRVLYVAARRDTGSVRRLVDATYPGLPGVARAAIVRGLIPLASTAHRAKPARVARDLERIRDLLAQAEEWCDEGLLGSDSPNVADFQFAPNVVALGEIRGPVGDAVRKLGIWARYHELLPRYPLDFALELPSEWERVVTGP